MFSGVNVANEGASLTVELTGRPGEKIRTDAVRIERISTVGFTYDANSNLETTTDSLGRTTIFTYDALGRLKTETLPDPDGAESLKIPQTRYTYDGYGNVRKVEDLQGTTVYRETHREYDFRNRLTAETLDATGSESVTTKFEYDGAGNLKRLLEAYETADEVFTSYAYDNLNRRTEEILDADRLASDPSPDPNARTPVKQKTIFTYDAHGNLETTTQYATSAATSTATTTKNIYDKANRLMEVTQDYLSPHLATTTFDYDDVGNLVGETDPTGRTTTSVYDRLNRLVETELPDPDGVAGPLQPPRSTFAYDALGNLIQETRGGPGAYETTQFVYSSSGHVLRSMDPAGKETNSTYDSEGNLLALTDPNFNTTTYTYDALDRVIVDTNELGHSRFYTYNDEGQLERLIDRNHRRRDFQYDGLGRLTRENWWNSKLTTPDTADDLIHYLAWEYDKLGRVIAAGNVPTETANVFRSATIKLSKSSVSHWDTYVYDNLGRVLEQSNYRSDTTDGSTPTSWLDITTNPLVRQAFTYDLQDTSDSDTFIQTQYTQHVAVDDDSTPDLIQVGNTTFSFDRLGRLKHMGDQLLSQSRKNITFTYDPAGRQDRVTRRIDGQPSFHFDTNYAYDNAGRLDGIEHVSPNGQFATFNYGYDAASRINQIDSVFSYPGVDFSRTQEFDFDPTGQLTGHTSTTGGIADNPNNYTYDDNGNRLTASGYQSQSNTVGTNNQLASDGTYDYFYDREGNLVRRTEIATGQTTEYVWDHHNRLVEQRDFGSEAINFNQVSLLRYGPEDTSGNQTARIYDGGATLRLDGNIDRAIDLSLLFGDNGYEVTGSTVMEFDFQSSENIRFNGFIFENDLSVWGGVNEMFRLYGWEDGVNYLDRGDGVLRYAQADGTKHYRISVGSILGRYGKLNTFRYLAFFNNSDRKNFIKGSSTFSNIRIYEHQDEDVVGMQRKVSYSYDADGLQVRKIVDKQPNVTEINFDDFGFGANEYFNGAPEHKEILEDGRTIYLQGHTSYALIMPKEYLLTQDTIIEFKFSSTTEGFYHAIGFHDSTDTTYGYRRGIQFFGNGTLQNHVGDEERYTLGEGTRLYRLRVGDFYESGNSVQDNLKDFNRLLLMNVSQGGIRGTLGNSTFTDIRIYEDTGTFPDPPSDVVVEHHVYNSGQAALVLDDKANLKHRYTHGPGTDSLLVDEVFDDMGNIDDMLWTVTDHQGTVHDLIDEYQDLIEHRDYDAFGEITQLLNPANVPLLDDDGDTDLSQLSSDYAFAGRVWDNDAELYYNRARWYDARTGRFIAVDPIGFESGDANLYRYAGNDPVNFRDPSGLFLDFGFGFDSSGFLFDNSGLDFGGFDLGGFSFGGLDSFNFSLSDPLFDDFAFASYSFDTLGFGTMGTGSFFAEQRLGGDLGLGFFGIQQGTLSAGNEAVRLGNEMLNNNRAFSQLNQEFYEMRAANHGIDLYAEQPLDKRLHQLFADRKAIVDEFNQKNLDSVTLTVPTYSDEGVELPSYPINGLDSIVAILGSPPYALNGGLQPSVSPLDFYAGAATSFLRSGLSTAIFDTVTDLASESVGFSVLLPGGGAPRTTGNGTRRVTQFFDPSKGDFPIDGRFTLSSQPTVGNRIFDGINESTTFVAPQPAAHLSQFDRLLTGVGNRRNFVEFDVSPGELIAPGGTKRLFAPFQQTISGQVDLLGRNPTFGTLPRNNLDLGFRYIVVPGAGIGAAAGGGYFIYDAMTGNE